MTVFRVSERIGDEEVVEESCQWKILMNFFPKRLGMLQAARFEPNRLHED